MLTRWTLNIINAVPSQPVPSHWGTQRRARSRQSKQTEWPLSARCMGSDLFLAHLWLDPFTQTPGALCVCGYRVTNLHPSNNSAKYHKVTLPLHLTPTFCSLLCFKSGSTSKHLNGQINSGKRQMLFHKILSFRCLLVTVRSCNGTIRVWFKNWLTFFGKDISSINKLEQGLLTSHEFFFFLQLVDG